MTTFDLAALVAAFLAQGGRITLGPTMWANGALHYRCRHAVAR